LRVSLHKQSGLTFRVRGISVVRRLRSTINDRGSGPADFAFSLQSASVAGTITTRDDRSVAVDMIWEGTGETKTSNTTTFPGSTGHFKGKLRDAVATGTVVVNGETLVDGSTTNAEIETLEDKNTFIPVGTRSERLSAQTEPLCDLANASNAPVVSAPTPGSRAEIAVTADAFSADHASPPAVRLELLFGLLRHGVDPARKLTPTSTYSKKNSCHTRM
jgi:hypothetical protein